MTGDLTADPHYLIHANGQLSSQHDGKVIGSVDMTSRVAPVAQHVVLVTREKRPADPMSARTSKLRVVK